MKRYWPLRFGATVTAQPAEDVPDQAVSEAHSDDDYDNERAALLRTALSEDGWKAELRRYFDDPTTLEVDHVELGGAKPNTASSNLTGNALAYSPRQGLLL